MATGIITRNCDEWHLIWENPSPDADFPAQTISVNLTGYNWIKIFCRNSNSTNFRRNILVPITSTTENYKVNVLMIGNHYFDSAGTKSAPTVYTRQFQANTEGIYISEGTYVNTQSSLETKSAPAGVMPMSIWALRGSI